MLPFWRLEFSDGCQIFGNSVQPSNTRCVYIPQQHCGTVHVLSCISV